jgi:FkbM family methyltransferase
MGIKRILLNTLGERRYLSLLSGAFQTVYRTGLLGSEYQDVYFLKKIIEPGAFCADIGAHLGYFTLELSRLAGPAGKVIAVEPMPKFNETLARLIKRKAAHNVSLHQVALGGEGEWVEMGIPKIGNTKKFAYARIMQSANSLEFVESVKVPNETGDRLFGNLPRLDFIKCDVEGLELQVFSSMTEVLRIHRPMLLCELADKGERVRLFEMIQSLGYNSYRLTEGRLESLDVYSNESAISHNHYFIPQNHRARLGI